MKIFVLICYWIAIFVYLYQESAAPRSRDVDYHLICAAPGLNNGVSACDIKVDCGLRELAYLGNCHFHDPNHPSIAGICLTTDRSRPSRCRSPNGNRTEAAAMNNR